MCNKRVTRRPLQGTRDPGGRHRTEEADAAACMERPGPRVVAHTAQISSSLVADTLPMVVRDAHRRASRSRIQPHPTVSAPLQLSADPDGPLRDQTSWMCPCGSLVVALNTSRRPPHLHDAGTPASPLGDSSTNTANPALLALAADRTPLARGVGRAAGKAARLGCGRIYAGALSPASGTWRSWSFC